MKKLAPENYEKAAHLLMEIEYHTVLRTILAGTTTGQIFVNDLDSPDIALVRFSHHLFICGNPHADDTEGLKAFIIDELFDELKQEQLPFFRLSASQTRWLDIFEQILQDYDPIRVGYQCYQYLINRQIEDISIPKGLELRPVKEALLQEKYSGREDLMEEMCSERVSVEAFLEKSFGIAAFQDKTLAGWCLSEYNHQNRCEIGIATLPPYQRRGLAKAMTLKFLNMAHRQGIDTVLWHCFKSNLPSSHTALSSGFKLVQDEDVLMVYLDPALNYAIHGNLYFENEGYLDALVWYEKALAQKNTQTWMAWNAACAAAHTNQIDLAFNYLNRAVDLGFSDIEYLQHSQHLKPIRDEPRWEALINCLSQNSFS